MARQDRDDAADDKELAPVYLTLLGAIEQTLASQKMIESMEVRRQAIRGQMAVTRDETILEALLAEEMSLHRTLRLTGERIAQAIEFFNTTTIKVNGMKVPVTEAVKIMKNLKAQAEQFIAFEKEVEIYHGNDAGLQDYAEAFQALTLQMAQRWAMEWSAFMAILEGVRVNASDVHEFEIGTFTGRVIIEATWDNAKRKWMVDEGVANSDGRIEKILSRLNQQMATRTAEEGTRLRIQITLNAKGDAHFECDLSEVSQPNFTPFANINTSSTGTNWTTT